MKLTKLLPLIVFAWLATASNFALAAVIYTYTGNNFTSFVDDTADSVVYDSSMSILGTVELVSALTANTTATVTALSFSFSDGNQTLTQADAGIDAAFTFTTDSLGDIIEWNVKVQIPLPGSPSVGDKDRTILTQNDISNVTDIGSIATVDSLIFGSPISTVDSGEVLNPGVWTSDINPVPLPAAVWLFGSGLLGLVATGRRRRS